jgi:hypothetical protein
MAKNKNRAGTGRSKGTGRNKMQVRNTDPDLESGNLGLGRREQRALEAENHGLSFFRKGVVANRARKGGNR